MNYKYEVKGTKDNGKRGAKKFHCYADAREFMESCGWEEAEVSKVEPELLLTSELTRRGHKAAVRYLELQGFDILDSEYKHGWKRYIVAREGNVIVFADVRVSDSLATKNEMDESLRLQQFEEAAIEYLAFVDEIDIPVRFDRILMAVVGTDRAFVKHYKNFHVAGDIDD